MKGKLDQIIIYTKIIDMKMWQGLFVYNFYHPEETTSHRFLSIFGVNHA